MAKEILNNETGSVGIRLDPRTKLFLILVISVFVLGGAGGGVMVFVRPLLCMIPLALLLSCRRFGAAAIYAGIYSISYISRLILPPDIGGAPYFIILFVSDVLCRFVPSLMTGYYVVTSTTVSEFTAGMNRMRVTDKIVIPLSVMFRFFPTVAEEAQSIGNAMRMRGIRFGGGKTGKMLEYRIVPLMTCSVKIGDELSAAALTRGLGAPVKRTNICTIGFHAQDVLVFALCMMAVVGFALNLAGLA